MRVRVRAVLIIGIVVLGIGFIVVPDNYGKRLFMGFGAIMVAIAFERLWQKKMFPVDKFNLVYGTVLCLVAGVLYAFAQIHPQIDRKFACLTAEVLNAWGAIAITNGILNNKPEGDVL